MAETVQPSAFGRARPSWRTHQRSQDRAAIAHHYDVGNDFYRLWLDERMVYSCAYFRTGDETIDEAQVAKLDHICRKLRLTPGDRFLDVGCGWGGLVVHAVQNYGVQAVGITLSGGQAKLARERVEQAGLAGRAEIVLMDYRDLLRRFGPDRFDKAASIGMFEHVGLRNLPVYFSTIAAVLRDRGLFLNHGITSADVENRPVGSAMLTFAVVGGGPTGVETAGALAELIIHVMPKDYPQMDLQEVRVLLLEAGPSVMPAYPDELRKATFDLLRSKNVEIMLDTKLIDYNGEEVSLGDGAKIKTQTLIWTAGVRSAGITDRLGLQQAAGRRIRVEPTLQLPGCPEVFIIGDATYLEDEHGQALPMLAPVALQEAGKSQGSWSFIHAGRFLSE